MCKKQFLAKSIIFILYCFHFDFRYVTLDIYIYNMHPYASVATLNLYANLYCAEENGCFLREEFLSEV